MKTFENFTVTPANNMAYTAALQAIEKPAFWNPLVLYGSTGAGKTHLLRAILARTMELFPEKKLLYVTGAEVFVDLWNFHQEGSEYAYLERFIEADVLLFDDLQDILYAEWAQETVAAIFDFLCKHKVQIVIASPKRPRELENISADLLFQLESGLMAELRPLENCGTTEVK